MAARPIPEGMTIYRPRRPLKYVPRDCTCDGLRVRIKFMGLYGRPLLALAGFLVFIPFSSLALTVGWQE